MCSLFFELYAETSNTKAVRLFNAAPAAANLDYFALLRYTNDDPKPVRYELGPVSLDFDLLFVFSHSSWCCFQKGFLEARSSITLAPSNVLSQVDTSGIAWLTFEVAGLSRINGNRFEILQLSIVNLI